MSENKLSREELLERFERILYKDAKGEWIRRTRGRDLEAYHKIKEIIHQYFEWQEAILWLKDIVEGNFNEIGKIKSLLSPIPEEKLDEFVEKWTKWDWHNLIDIKQRLKRLLKEYDALKGEGGG